jgi:hypothetical protein
MGGRPPRESPADFTCTSFCEISLAVIEVTVAGLRFVRRAPPRADRPVGLIAFKTWRDIDGPDELAVALWV